MTNAYQPVLVMVQTVDCATDTFEKWRVIDHNNPADREWLGKHAWWAVRSGKGLITRPETDWPVGARGTGNPYESLPA